MLREAFADLDDWISGARGENGTAQYGEYTSLPSATILWRRWEGHTCCVLQSYVAVEAAEGPMASPCYRGWCDGLSGHHHATIEEAVSDLRDGLSETNLPSLTSQYPSSCRTRCQNPITAARESPETLPITRTGVESAGMRRG